MLLLVRRVGALVLVGAAVFIWYAKAPEAPPRADHRAAAAASHQTVRDIRPSALLVLVVCGIGLLAFTTPGPLLPAGVRRRIDRPATAAPPIAPPIAPPLGPPPPPPPPGAHADAEETGPIPRPTGERIDTTKTLEGLPFRSHEPPREPPGEHA